MSQALLGPWPRACSQPRADQASAGSLPFTEDSLRSLDEIQYYIS